MKMLPQSLWGYPRENDWLVFSARRTLRACARIIEPDVTGWDPLSSAAVSWAHFRMVDNRTIIRMLAQAFSSGQWQPEAMVARGTKLLGKRYRWLPPLAQRVHAAFGDDRIARQSQLVAFLERDRNLRRALAKRKATIVDWLLDAPAMRPIPAAAAWQLPAITSVGGLAEWLGISMRQLRWLADEHELHLKNADRYSSHYCSYLIRKRDKQVIWNSQQSSPQLWNVIGSQGVLGRSAFRLIEAPKRQLKLIQRRILYGILDLVPTHIACCGFRPGLSIKDYASPHCDKPILLKMDLRDFYPSISYGRIFAIFLSLGYPEEVTRVLARLCTVTSPTTLWMPQGVCSSSTLLSKIYAARHLPQGAPTSPVLANLSAYRLDCRLAGFAKHLQLDYTRYADDLAFSGDESFGGKVKRAAATIATVISEEGFAVNERKTKVMSQATQQRLAGVVVNKHPNIRRKDYERMKAILTNCLRHGVEGQNRANHPDFRGYLTGMIGYIAMINPTKGAKLQQLYQQIKW